MKRFFEAPQAIETNDTMTTTEARMANHKVVTHEQWIEARRKFLVKEKEFTHLRDRLSKERRDLPWEAVEKEYVFDGPSGARTLSDLFEGRSQLVVYHAMFAPDAAAACKQCSFWIDNFHGIALRR
jgi:predicted dithiol-disulfide oxidoreductase (DUF899 family)